MEKKGSFRSGESTRAMRCPYHNCESSAGGKYPFKTHEELVAHLNKHNEGGKTRLSVPA